VTDVDIISVSAISIL